MGRLKVQRKSTSIDMTAMCDVSFLLLTFFILTATARQPDPLSIVTPSSTVQFKVPDKDISILSIGKGKVFMEIIGRDVKILTLKNMATLYSTSFSEEETTRFAVVGAFGVPFNQLKNYINADTEGRTKLESQFNGIPTDSTQNGELFRWVEQSRRATAELHNIDMRISIKGDANEGYPAIRSIVDVLQRQGVNKFSLITSAEAAGK